MTFLFVLVGVVLVVVIGLVAIGRETSTMRDTARPAVFDLTEAVEFIAERLPAEAAGRLTHADVRWILMADVDLLEDASDDSPGTVDEDGAVARILARADQADRDLVDQDVASVLDARTDYLVAIGAIGPRATDA